MDVKFTTVARMNLNTVPIIDGQLVAVQDANAMYYDMNSKRRQIGAVSVCETLSGTGDIGQAVIVTGGQEPGIYVWDEASKAYTLIANKDTDTYMSFIKKMDNVKRYLVSCSGDSESKDLYWNDNIWINYQTGTIAALEFSGLATKAKQANKAANADNAEKAKKSDVADKIGTETIGNSVTATYILNGVPTACSHSVKCDVPANAKFTDTTYSVFTGATKSATGTTGLVPQPGTSDTQKFLKADGTWSNVVIPVMTGCTSTSQGTSGLVPVAGKGRQDNFLKGDGTWSSYSAGYGLELYNLTLSLEDSGAEAGTYGPTPNEEEMTVFKGDYIVVPQITVDSKGRITKIVNVPCYLNQLAKFSDQPESKETPVQVPFNFELKDDGTVSVTEDDSDTN